MQFPRPPQRIEHQQHPSLAQLLRFKMHTVAEALTFALPSRK
jgi:hypothetical protein